LLVAAVRASDDNLQLYWLTIPLAIFCLFVLIALSFARSQDVRARRLFGVPKDEPTSVFHSVSRVISAGTSRITQLSSPASRSGSVASRSGSVGRQSINGEIIAIPLESG
jgi:hypothetical protein